MNGNPNTETPSLSTAMKQSGMTLAALYDRCYQARQFPTKESLLKQAELARKQSQELCQEKPKK